MGFAHNLAQKPQNSAISAWIRTFRKFRIVAPLCFLAACHHTQPGVKVQTVYVPQPQPCLPADKIPEEPPRVADELTGNAAVDLPIVAASALRLRAWGQELAAAHMACASE